VAAQAGSWSATVKEEGTNIKNFSVLGINYLISTKHINRLQVKN